MQLQGDFNKVQNFEGENLQETLGNVQTPTIVDFFAQWCGPCKILAPVLANISEKYEDLISIIKVDIDKYSDTAREYEVQSVPTLIFFLNGKEVKRTIGFMPEEKLIEVIEEVLGVKV